MMTKQSKASRSGFTLIEMLVVILIIGILAAYFGQNIYGQSDDAKSSVAYDVLTQRIPYALMAYTSTTGQPLPHHSHTSTQRKVLALVEARGVSRTTPWGGRLTFTSQASYGITANYPVGTGDKAEERARKIADSIKKSRPDNSMISNVYTRGSKVLVRYRVK